MYITQKNLPFKLYLNCDSRELFAYEWNGNDVHETIVTEFAGQLREYAIANGGRLIANHGVRNYGGRIMTRSMSGTKTKFSAKFPPVLRDRLVLQIGVAESVASLHSHAAHLFANHTGVQVYVFIKIWKQRVNTTRAVCIAVYRRASLVPVQLMSVGDAVPGRQFMQFFTNQFPNPTAP
jgi:hypothetical protein